jgi:hypothetical protein
MLGSVSQITGSADQRPPSRVAFTFHHLHLNDPAPPSLLEFYERLFDPATSRRTRVGRTEGLQSGPMLLLISGAPAAPPHASALWHFGWGEVSLGETYLAHAMREVAWEPPLPAGRLHLHVRSVAPAAAIAWYRDVLGAGVVLPDGPPRGNGDLPPPEHRIPEALVWIGDLGLLIYRTDPPLLSSRGQTADHVAFATPDIETALAELRAGVAVTSPIAHDGDLRSAMIEGPDRLAIELVEQR